MRRKLSVNKLSGQYLYRLKLDYNSHREIRIKDRYLQWYLEFIELTKNDLSELVQSYKSVDSHFPPAKIRKNKYHHTAQYDSPLPPSPVASTNSLEYLAKFKWWFYLYEYECPPDSSKSLIRLVLSFIPPEQSSSWEIQIKNIGAPYKDYRGYIKKVQDNLLIAELYAGKNQMELMLSLEDSRDKEIYIGIYLKHNSVGKICSGSVIIHRIIIKIL